MNSPTATASPAIDTRLIWAIALPAMVTNVATALIGVGDMWIVGQLGDAPTQGAVDIGAKLFAALFTVMNFLKTGTTGLVAQAGTRSGARAQADVLIKGLVVGLAIAAMLLLAKPVLMPLLLDALGAEARVRTAALVYADIRYWSAPAVMANFALVGFLVGRRRMREVLAIEILYNLLNVALGLWLALGLNWGIAGIGWSSFIAEFVKLAIAGTIIWRIAGSDIQDAVRNGTNISLSALKPFLAVNRDLFLRTVVLMIAIAALTRLGAERGPVVLAANGIVYQLFVLAALLLDGFENAAQVLNGERAGEDDRAGFTAFVRAILWRCLGMAIVLALVLAAFGGAITDNFAATPAVAAEARKLWPWLIAIPLAGFAGFVLDGVFVGASWTRALLGTMAAATAGYALLLWLTWPLGNDGLWGSFIVFLIVRAVLQLAMMPRLLRRHFP
ncbi:MATE family efflux transporter [Qipengyuania qiaonensis]|uniref:MATE family efflux transporter n=1 Tax=Qipengyuania qiaonensis TaxID=2867240 RepID=A0ABS7J6T1_9SPHN|nr:MATE family efflux transporter [Qipengyuania qiaonensis]MBX7483020.1 MATE family efflux transporter [Qipengyuania qiaonensis]